MSLFIFACINYFRQTQKARARGSGCGRKSIVALGCCAAGRDSRCFLARLEAFLHPLGLGRNLLRDETNFLFRCYEFATIGGGVIVKSLVVKRSIVVAGHKTSVTLEDAFWNGLKEIASGRNITLSDLVTAVDSERRQGNLSSAIRLFVLDFYRNQLADVKDGRDDAEGHLAVKVGAVTTRPNNGGP